MIEFTSDKNNSVYHLQLTHTKHTEEIWKNLPEYSVAVSNLGNIKSIGHRKPVKISLSNGYKQIGRWSSSGAVSIHRLVLLAFVGPCPDGHEGDHINGIRTDNRLENLRYVTRTENINGSVARGHRGASRWNAKLTDAKVRQIREMRKNGISVKEIAKQLSVSESAAFHVLNRTSWAHVS